MYDTPKLVTFASSRAVSGRGPRLPSPTAFTPPPCNSSRGVLSRAFFREWGNSVGWNLAYVLAAGVNLAVLGYISHKLYKATCVQLEQYAQLKKGASRCWQLATQGAEAAGPVGADLGEADEHGVYTYESAAGTVYFRQSHHSYGRMHWEFSTDRVFWIPVCHADSLWYSPDSCPSIADKVLIQRLEVETQLVSQQTTNTGSCAADLPELDLSAACVDVTKLSQVPPVFLCPISMQIMTQPVVTPSGGSFNRPALMEWIRQHHTDPVSGAPLRSDQVFPNIALRDMIHAWANECAAPRGRNVWQKDQQQQWHVDVCDAVSSRCSSPTKAAVLQA